MAVMGIWLLKKISHAYSLEQVIAYLIPYWERGDGTDKLLGVLQISIISFMSFYKAIQSETLEEGLIIFLVTFLSFVWTIKLLTVLVEWLQDYIKTMPINILFTLLVPLLVSEQMNQMKSEVEISACLVALLMSLIIVYMELISLVLGKSKRGKWQKYNINTRAMKIKSILTWLFIIMINLYSLLVFIQFNMTTDTWHFIPATIFNKESAVDLLYYLVITFTTVGFGDIQPHTLMAKMITILIAISGMLFTGIFVASILTLEEDSKK